MRPRSTSPSSSTVSAEAQEPDEGRAVRIGAGGNPCAARVSTASGWGDSNSRPLVPQTSALTKLRHSPYACGAGTLSSRTAVHAGPANSVTAPCHDDLMVVSALVERLEAVDIRALDAVGVIAALRELDRVKGFVSETEHALARRANALAAAGSGAPADELIGRGGTCSKRQAEQISRRAEALGSLPAVSVQLGKGRIGTEHADTLAHAAKRLDDDGLTVLQSLDEELATAAAASTPAQFRRYVERVVDQLAADRGLERAARQRNATSLAKGVNAETGMYWLRAEFDPESGARLFRAIDAETAALSKGSDSASRFGIRPLQARCSRARRPRHVVQSRIAARQGGASCTRRPRDTRDRPTG